MNNYDEIAESWYRLRHWTRFKNELDEVAARWRHGRLLNIGCAHGPDFLPFKDSYELWGLDSSTQMIRMAVKYAGKFRLNANLLVGDAVSLPFRDAAFDYAISVAAYHHIRDKNQRAKAFRELRRVLKPGAEAFITVWNRWQREFWNRGNEVMVPWNTNNGTVMRYYYLYSYPEIENNLKQAGFKVLKSFPEKAYGKRFKYFSRNICLLVRAA